MGMVCRGEGSEKQMFTVRNKGFGEEETGSNKVIREQGGNGRKDWLYWPSVIILTQVLPENRAVLRDRRRGGMVKGGAVCIVFQQGRAKRCGL